MTKVKKGFENQCSEEESGLKNGTTKTESHPQNKK
jgi:hypothetical protein